MSDSKSNEILKKKHARGKQSKLKQNKNKPKLIPKKLKIGKKTKNNSRQIDIIKPKPIKKLISYQNFAPPNINQIIPFEKAFPDEENEFKKEDSCQENSLGQLTKNFINYIKTTGKKAININDLVDELNVKKRRIYDITNVLQGIGYLQKSGKNEIVWTKTIMNKAKSRKKLSNQKKINNKQKINKDQLEQEKEQYENEINNYKEEFNSIAKKNEFAKYGYITTDDLKKFSLDEKVDLLIIKATKGTVMNIVDKKEIKIAYEKVKKLMESGEMKTNDVLLNILKKNNQLIFNCPEEIGLNLYNVKNGEIQEIGTNMNNNNKNTGKNISVSKIVSNNNFNINNYIENKNYNLAYNFNVNINKDDIMPNTTNNTNNTNNNIKNNIKNKFFAVNNIQEELGQNKFQSTKNSSFTKTKSFFLNNTEGNNDTIPHNITVNNEQKNIGVHTIQSKGSYKYNSQFGDGFELINYKNKVKLPDNNNNNNNFNNINNINNVNNNLIEENFSFTANSHYQNKIVK